jgi:hypothetical protein
LFVVVDPTTRINPPDTSNLTLVRMGSISYDNFVHPWREKKNKTKEKDGSE